MLDYRQRTTLAVWINRLNPFVPSLGMIGGIVLARRLIETTDLKELSNLLFFVQLYFIYLFVRMFLKVGLEVVFSTGSVEKMGNLRFKIAATSSRVSRLYFARFAVLHLIEDTVRRALVYNLVSSVVFWITVAVIILEFRKWRNEIAESFRFRYQGLWEHVSPMYSLKLGTILLPIFLVAVVGHDVYRFVSSHLLRTDLVKRLLSEVLRRQLEKVEGESRALTPPPDDYLAMYDYYLPAEDSFFVDREGSPLHEIEKMGKAWLNQAGLDDLAIVVGNRGMGKSTLLAKAYARSTCPSKTLTKVPARTADVESFFIWLSDLTKSQIRSVRDFVAYDLSLKERTIFFVDDIQNLFLGTIGGFEAYRIFLEILSLKTANIFLVP
ncbi:MAG: hypothetical protein HC883_03275 [Bdellovibrionaceae bacterium]|nr:hypothetical protein [Pseudobdellovibrionaceae bacterium]